MRFERRPDELRNARALDDRTEEPVEVPPLDQEGDAHHTLRAAPTATRARTSAVATRDAPAPSTVARPRAARTVRSSASPTRRASAPTSEGPPGRISPARPSASTFGRWLSARQDAMTGVALAKHS